MAAAGKAAKLAESIVIEWVTFIVIKSAINSKGKDDFPIILRESQRSTLTHLPIQIKADTL